MEKWEKSVRHEEAFYGIVRVRERGQDNTALMIHSSLECQSVK